MARGEDPKRAVGWGLAIVAGTLAEAAWFRGVMDPIKKKKKWGLLGSIAAAAVTAILVLKE